MPNPIDLTGQRFGRLLVIELADRKNGCRYWRCLCDCGREHLVSASNLRWKGVTSCGCARSDASRITADGNIKHGETSVRQRRLVFGECIGRKQSPEYAAWHSAIDRCHNPRSGQWRNYGGRGIKMCDLWRTDFAAFLAYLGRRPSSQHSLGRIDNNRGYEPGNVRWETRSQQSYNRRPQDRVVLKSWAAAQLSFGC